ncbi:MAG TPA: SdrD B-like domain-containing protein [Dehalococcoidia bacterium]
MKLAAVVPALFVLISLCGSPVPAPPGSVSGVAFYDANRNGIHDSCDRPLALATVVATAADGKAETSTSGPDGTFHIDKVDPGLARVTLAAPDGEVWHTTTVAADGIPGAIVQVKDLRDSGGVEIGATSPSPLSSTRISVSGVIFNDYNGNGQIDKDECGIPQSWAYVSGNEGKTSGTRFDSGPSGGNYFFYGLDAAGTVHPNLPGPGWVATTGGPGGDPCSRGIVPTSWNGTTVYEANIGFKRDTTTGSFTGTVFDDRNSNGVRDAGEVGVPGVELLLNPNDAGCGLSGPSNTTTDSTGQFVFNGVQAGSYQLAIPQNLSRHDNQIISLDYPPHQYTVAPAGLAADIPARIQPAGYINAQLFNDDNGNGQWDTGEDPALYVDVCLSNAPQNVSPCTTSDDTGLAVFGPVPTGNYSIEIGRGFSGPMVARVQLDAPDSVSVDVPVGFEPTPTFVANSGYRIPSPGVIPSGGAAQTITTCYSDPGWVQRPFEDGYDPAQPFYASWKVDEAAARTIYGLGIYAATPTNTPYTYVWSAIAGLPWREPPGCDPLQTNGPTPIYDLVGLEPISAVADQGATQITVQPANHGLYGISLSPKLQLNGNGQTPAKHVLFVDESATPITHCDALGVCQRY